MTELDRLTALTTHGIRQAFSGRRLIGIGVLAVVPLALAVTIVQVDPSVGAGELDPVLLVVGLGLVVPLIALLIGVSALREELEEGTIVHLVTRPVRRESVLITRLIASAAAVVIVGAVALTLPLVVIGGAAGVWGIALQVTVLTALAYTSLFALLGAVTKRAVLLGLVYLVGWEGVVASTPLVFRKLTVAYWARSIVANQDLTSAEVVRGMLTGPAASTPTSILVLLGVAVVAAGLGAAWFGHREFAGPEPEE